MSEDKVRIITHNNKVITLQEFFEADQETRMIQAKLPFEEKIRILISLQKLAITWGGKKDVILWDA